MIALNKDEVVSVYTYIGRCYVDVRAGMKSGLPLCLATFTWKAGEARLFKAYKPAVGEGVAHDKADALVRKYSDELGLVNVEVEK